MEKPCRKYASKASPRTLFYFGKQPKKNCIQEVILRIRYFKRGLSKTLRDLKQKGLETSDQSLFRLWNKIKKISLLVIYYQPKFELFQNLHLQI